MSKQLPHAIAENVMMIGSIRLRVYVLNDGRRVINADDAEAFFAALGDGVKLDPDEAEAFARMVRGLSS